MKTDNITGITLPGTTLPTLPSTPAGMFGIFRKSDETYWTKDSAGERQIDGKASLTGLDTTGITLDNNTVDGWYLGRTIAGGTLSGLHATTLSHCYINGPITHSGTGTLKLSNCVLTAYPIQFSGSGSIIIDNCVDKNTASYKVNYTSTSGGKVYISNSPNVNVNGVTSSNWGNIFRDGYAYYLYAPDAQLSTNTSYYDIPSAYIQNVQKVTVSVWNEGHGAMHISNDTFGDNGAGTTENHVSYVDTDGSTQRILVYWNAGTVRVSKYNSNTGNSWVSFVKLEKWSRRS
jgi:hypothetical protein